MSERRLPLSTGLAKAEATARAEAAAASSGSSAASAVVLDLSALFKGEGCLDGDEIDTETGRHVRRWPSALRSFISYCYSGMLWPTGWGCPDDMDRGDFGSGRDPRFPQDNLRIVVMDRLQFLEKLARPLCLPLLAYAARSFLESFAFLHVSVCRV